ncbi:MAG: TolC family protein [Gemmatimonas sp.]|uniref:TolC family protein n=1 Tax=Gemmatimonas sp. TaxID=1962908 RepID=UPI0022C5DF63|nr:TolC family protein [Gemmatimonas sp.]MCZ8011232.1 TolC family protein [Gemmatimonas sp.]MCZ8266589.1 TolC family protein [Gemmatimonas sp.]
MRTTHYSLVAAATLALPGLLAAQSPLRLADALAEADRRAFANRQATANAANSRAQAALPLKGILPSARVEGGFVRTTDPIGAFGTTLRQRAVTPAAFDPARLNDPAPVNNMTGGLVLEVPVFNADALTGWRAARSAADAHDAMADWTAVNTRAMVVKAYYGAVLAEEKVAMLTQAKRAAESAVKQVESMVRQGLVTKADQLQASVRAGDIESQLLAARNDAITARQQLAMLLGRTDTALVALPTSLPGDSVVRAFARSTPMGSGERTAALTRDDVRAAQLGARAAAADRQRATATLLPRVNGFARYDYNSPTTLYGGRPNWTVGVMGSWSLFGGASELADVAGASARARSARAGEEAAQVNARVETEAAARGVTLALQRLDLATMAAAQSREAHRLVEKRYGGGLATVAELLGAETAATGAALAEAAARYTLIDALAQHRRAIGADPGALAQLDGRHAASTNDVRNEDPTP